MAAVLLGGCIRNRVARPCHRPSSHLPLDTSPGIDTPVRRVQPIAVVKYVATWMVALVHLWALLDRMEDGPTNRWRLVKPTAWLLAWVSERESCYMVDGH